MGYELNNCHLGTLGDTNLGYISRGVGAFSSKKSSNPASWSLGLQRFVGRLTLTG